MIRVESYKEASHWKQLMLSIKNPVVAEVIAHPFGWAEDCYYKANAILGLNTKDTSKLKHMNVVVYGPSQVGKTTLILHLLGVVYDPKLENLLRGGRPAGNSSTATAILYTQSEDDHFRMAPNPEKPKDDKSFCIFSKDDESGIKQFLAKWRENIESGKEDKFPSNYLYIAIPKCYFSQEELNKDTIFNLIDIPGVNSSETKEYNYVDKLCKNFVPTAAGIICVSKADALGSLCPSARSPLKNWFLEIEKYHFVTTYSYSPESLIDFFKNTNAYKDLQKRIYREVLSFKDDKNGWGKNRIEENDFADYFFPLDLGQSFANLMNNQELKERFLAFQKEGTEKLKDNLQKRTSSFYHLKSVFGYPKRYNGFRNKKIEQCSNAITSIEARLKKREVQIANFNKEIEKNNLKISNLKNLSVPHYTPQEWRSTDTWGDDIKDIYKLRSDEVRRYLSKADKYKDEYLEFIHTLEEECDDFDRKTKDLIFSKKNEVEEAFIAKTSQLINQTDNIPSNISPWWGKNYWFESDRIKFRRWLYIDCISNFEKSIKEIDEPEEHGSNQKGTLEQIKNDIIKKLSDDKNGLAECQKDKTEKIEQLKKIKYDIESKRNQLEEEKRILPEIPQKYQEMLLESKNELIKKINESIKRYSSKKEIFLAYIAIQQVEYISKQLTGDIKG